VISGNPWLMPPSWGTSFSRILFSPTTPAHIALPLHEHQPLLLQEAAGLQTWAFDCVPDHTGFSGRLETRPIASVRFCQINTQSIIFEYHSK